MYATVAADSCGLDQVLVYFAVAKKGEAPTDGKTDLNPEGLTAAYGPHAESVAHLLHANGLSCGLPAKPDFVKAMLEKLVWIWWVAGTPSLAVLSLMCTYFMAVAGAVVLRCPMLTTGVLLPHCCSAYMVVGARHKAKVGEVEQQHRDEVSPY